MKRHFLSKRETKEFKSLLDGFGIVVESKTLEIEENDHSVVYDLSFPFITKLASDKSQGLHLNLLPIFEYR